LGLGAASPSSGGSQYARPFWPSGVQWPPHPQLPPADQKGPDHWRIWLYMATITAGQFCTRGSPAGQFRAAKSWVMSSGKTSNLEFFDGGEGPPRPASRIGLPEPGPLKVDVIVTWVPPPALAGKAKATARNPESSPMPRTQSRPSGPALAPFLCPGGKTSLLWASVTAGIGWQCVTEFLDMLPSDPARRLQPLTEMRKAHNREAKPNPLL